MNDIKKQKISLTYLFAVPLLVLLLGFGVGHVSSVWYLSGWFINTLFMVLALRTLWKRHLFPDQLFTYTTLLLIAPWILIPVFGGMGRPPQTVQGWLALENEQHFRYHLLIVAGVLAYLGTTLLYQLLLGKEKLFSTLGLGLMTLALPLYIITMAYWGDFLSEAFRHFTTTERPDWYVTFRELFLVIDTVAVFLFYLATAMFAMALGRAGFFKKAAVRTYVVISICAALLNLVPPSAPAPFSIASYLVSVPAVAFIMFYLMGVNLLWVGDRNQL